MLVGVDLPHTNVPAVRLAEARSQLRVKRVVSGKRLRVVAEQIWRIAACILHTMTCERRAPQTCASAVTASSGARASEGAG